MSDKDRITDIFFIKVGQIATVALILYGFVEGFEWVVERGDAWAMQQQKKDCMPLRNDVNTVVGSSCDE